MTSARAAVLILLAAAAATAVRDVTVCSNQSAACTTMPLPLEVP